MPIVVPSDSRARAGVLNENFARSMAGLGELAGPELGQFQQRQGLERRREAQLSMLDAMLSDEEDRAAELENTLRETGMGDVAERFRRRSRRHAFNMARRGLAQGSADIEGQIAAQKAAEDEAGQVAEQSRLSALEQVLKAQQQRDKLAQEVIRQDPGQAAKEQAGIGGVRRAIGAARAVDEARSQEDAIRRQADMARLGIITNALGNVGEASGNIMAARARSRAIGG